MGTTIFLAMLSAIFLACGWFIEASRPTVGLAFWLSGGFAFAAIVEYADRQSRPVPPQYESDPWDDLDPSERPRF